MGGGGRGMRVVHDEAQLSARLEEAQGEAKVGLWRRFRFPGEIFAAGAHLEVQILPTTTGICVICSSAIVRCSGGHQKVVEVAPAANFRRAFVNRTVRRSGPLARKANYRNAGTVEFLYDVDAQNVYFIEVNPRIQVEHTVTEVVTGIDLVRRRRY